MADDLNEIRERLEYSQAEISTIKREMDAFLHRAVETHSGIEEGLRVYHMRITQAVPINIRSRVGTTAHEIRSCLDALACVLAHRNNGDVSKTYFPISKTEEIFRKDGLGRKLREISSADRDKIERLQTHGEARPFLFGMHEFDRVRKHQRLAASVVGGPNVQVGDGEFKYVAISGTRELTSNWHKMLTVDLQSVGHINFEMEVTFLEPPEIAGMGVVTGLRRFLAEVRTIVHEFD